MATPDPFARFRTQTQAPAQEPQAPAPQQAAPQEPASQEFDPFARFRSPEVPFANIPRPENSLGEEFVKGLGQGVNSFQGSLFGVAGMLGRETGIGWMEEAGYAGAERNFAEGAAIGVESGDFTEIETAGGLFKWTAAKLGEAIPSIASAATGAGIGVAIGKKALEVGVKRSISRSVARRFTKQGFTPQESLVAARNYMSSETGQKAVTRAFTQPRTGAMLNTAKTSAAKKGGMAGAWAASTPQQVGQIDQELVAAGVENPGLTALLGGSVGGALEAIPALRLIDKMFPGVDRQVAKTFIKDFAVASGTQMLIEGGTEFVQEYIAMASLAYHDPTFDMFSPEARNRAINAFAAGAVVGAFTGGGATTFAHANEKLSNVKKANAPRIDAWRMAALQKARDAQSKADDLANAQEEIVPATNSVFEEIRDRAYASVQPHIEAAVNSLQAQVQKATDNLDAVLEGGLNIEGQKISALAKKAHERFIAEWTPQIDAAKKYLDEQSRRIAQTAETLTDPEARAKYIEDHLAAVKEGLAPLVQRIRQAAAARDSGVQAEVDNMDIDDDMLEQMGIEIQEEETERRVGPSGRKFDQAVGPEVKQESSLTPKEGTIKAGETESPPVIIWGRNQKRPKIGVDGKESVVGYPTKDAAEKGRAALKRRFLRSNKMRDMRKQDDLFRIVKNEQGSGWVIEAIDQDMRESQKFYDDLDAARDPSAPSKTAKPSVKSRKFSFPIDGEKFGFGKKMKTMHVDLLSLALKGKNIDPVKGKSTEAYFLAMATEMLTRGLIDTATFDGMYAQFKEHFGDVAKRPIRDMYANTEYNSEGAAKYAMIQFAQEMKRRGIKVPFNLLGVSEQNGKWTFGIDDVKIWRGMRAKNPAWAETMVKGFRNFTRQGTLTDAARQAGDFSANALDSEFPSSTIDGDPTERRRGDSKVSRPGDDAGDARIATDPIFTGRTGEGKRTAVRTKTGGQSEEGRSAAATIDSAPGLDDRETQGQGRNQPRTEDRQGNLSRAEEKGSKLGSEFDTRNKRQVKEGEPGLDKFDKSKRNNSESYLLNRE